MSEGDLVGEFERFSEETAEYGSPFYSRLSLIVAASPELLDLASEATSRPVPNLFFENEYRRTRSVAARTSCPSIEKILADTDSHGRSLRWRG